MKQMTQNELLVAYARKLGVKGNALANLAIAAAQPGPLKVVITFRAEDEAKRAMNRIRK